jgi:hypothetical protein
VEGTELKEKTERRKYPRIEARWPVSLTIGHELLRAETRNITADGIFINCYQPLPLDSTLRISIKPPEHHNVDVTGKVIWSESYASDSKSTIYGIGICFVEIDDKDWRFFERLVTSGLT